MDSDSISMLHGCRGGILLAVNRSGGRKAQPRAAEKFMKLPKQEASRSCQRRLDNLHRVYIPVRAPPVVRGVSSRVAEIGDYRGNASELSVLEVSFAGSIRALRLRCGTISARIALLCKITKVGSRI